MFRLPEGWSTPEALRDVIIADGVRIRRSGVAAVGPSGEEICGAAADRRRSAVDRAWFELAERVCAVEAAVAPRTVYALLTSAEVKAGTIAGTEAFPRSPPRSRWAPARTNGIAIHADWERASARAHWELVERDRVLRSWLGEAAPIPLQLRDVPPTQRYEWLAFAFPRTESGLSPELEVVGVFAFPRLSRLPLAMGFAARPLRAEALEAASGEALQQLAFLWGLPVPARRPRSRSPSPRLHMDTYQQAARRPAVRAWLAGGHTKFARRRRPSSSSVPAPVRFIDLTPAWLEGKARVAKAVSEAASPFGFGELPSTRFLPLELRIHPIP